MNLDAIVDAVVEEVGRPHQRNRVIRAVRATVVAAHSFERFAQDLVEDVILLEAPESVMKIPLPPRFRGIKSLRPLSKHGSPIPLSTHNGYYELVEPSDIVTEAGNDLFDIMYIAGNSLIVRSSVVPSKFMIHYFQIPDVSLGTLETWMMASYPEVIINGATGRFYRGVRQSKDAQEYSNMYQQDMANIAQTHIANWG
jgi:hypothetical protein